MATSTVPSLRDVELADYKLGSFLSDLEVIESTVSKILEPMTVEEYIALDESEREAKIASLPEPSVEKLTPLLVSPSISPATRAPSGSGPRICPRQ